MGLGKHNKGTGVNWGIETKGWEFKKISELEPNKDYILKGCFITPDRGYGEGAVLISDGFLVNISARYIDTVLDIQRDQEAVQEIKEGRGRFHYYKYKSERYHNEANMVEFKTV